MCCGSESCAGVYHIGKETPAKQHTHGWHEETPVIRLLVFVANESADTVLM
jgi:hypothetical protein